MVIHTRRLVLKAIRREDLGKLVQLFTDDIVKQTYMVPDFKNREEAEALANRVISLSEDEDRYVAGIYLEDDLVGILNETERSDESIEVGYALLPLYHNRGLCTEALEAAIQFFFSKGFSKVLAGAFEENRASIRVMEKSGMEKMEQTEEIEYRGKMHRCVYHCAERV